VKRPATIQLFTGIIFVLSVCLLHAADEQAVQKTPGFFAYWTLSKIWIAAALALVGTILLKLKKVTIPVRLILMGVAFLAFGIISELPFGEFSKGMGLHPSPMCVIEKPFLFLNAGRGIPLIFISLFTFVGLLTILSNKSFCGWTCPIGAIQELIYRIPILGKQKRTLPFAITNTIRTVIFILFVIMVFAINFTIYGWINAFHILHWSFDVSLIIPICISILGAFFIYRPFCYLICPLGLFTWLLEQVSIVRVKLNKSACTDCMICVKKSPCPTVPSILQSKKIRPDCHACGRCIEVCPEKALDFRIKTVSK
jgi:ferredoxin-type protein NapH